MERRRRVPGSLPQASRNLITRKGNQNVYASYEGTGGIPLDSFGKRLLFAWTQADINILLTSYLKPESRIQIWRNVQERVSQIAPFLKLDADPYRRGERRQAVLDPGCLHDFRPLSLFESPQSRLRHWTELHPQFREGYRGHVRRHGVLLRHGSR